MKHSLKHILLASVLGASLLLSACGQASSASASSAGSADATASSDGTVTITIGASPVPHEEILEQAVPLLAEKGIDLQIKSFSDYALVNPAVADGSLDANYFQTPAYLKNYNENYNETLTDVGAIHFEPMGIYPGKISAISEISNGSKIGIPNDASNQARALHVLDGQGIIKLKDDAGLTASILDVAENPNNVELIELAADQIPASLPDLDLGVVNGNYALGADIADTVLASDVDDPIAVKEYANIVAVKEKDKDNKAIKELVEVLKSDPIKTYIKETYKNTVVPVS